MHAEGRCVGRYLSRIVSESCTVVMEAEPLFKAPPSAAHTLGNGGWVFRIPTCARALSAQLPCLGIPPNSSPALPSQVLVAVSFPYPDSMPNSVKDEIKRCSVHPKVFQLECGFQ